VMRVEGDAITLVIDLDLTVVRPHRTLPHIACANECSSCAVRAAAAGIPSMIGFGAGLTPAGDDFATGFIAAARTRSCSELVTFVSSGVERRLGDTGDISASLLRWMLLDYWPDPLIDMADAIANRQQRAAMRALDELCTLGHSSGADIAAGFFFGLNGNAPGVPGNQTRSRV